MRVLAFKHFSFDDDSVFYNWTLEAGHSYTVIEPNEGQTLPAHDSYELLIIYGGPMSVYEEERHPWLREEKNYIREAIGKGKRVLGVCLGAQLIASALGARVSRNAEKEIGWHSIRRTASEHPLFSGMPQSFYSFQWHGDCFELPEGAELLAYSEATRHQAFAIGEHVLGLQFHLEPTPRSINEMLMRWEAELVAAPYIQNARHIRSELDRCEDSAAMLKQLLDRLAAG